MNTLYRLDLAVQKLVDTSADLATASPETLGLRRNAHREAIENYTALLAEARDVVRGKPPAVLTMIQREEIKNKALHVVVTSLASVLYTLAEQRDAMWAEVQQAGQDFENYVDSL